MPAGKTWSAKLNGRYRELEKKNKTTSTAYAQTQSITEKRLKKRQARKVPFLHWLSFQRRIIFIFIFSVCIFKLSFGFTSHCLCWLAQHRRKQAKTLTDKTKSRLEGANGKGENESDSPLKTKPLQKGPKRRTNQTGLKKSSCPPASPQLSRSSSSSCVLSSSSECRLFLKRKEN